MYGISKNKRKITPQKAVKILEEQGTEISLEQAELVLDFMYNFSKLAINQLLQINSEGNNQPIRHPGPG